MPIIRLLTLPARLATLPLRVAIRLAAALAVLVAGLWLAGYPPWILIEQLTNHLYDAAIDSINPFA